MNCTPNYSTKVFTQWQHVWQRMSGQRGDSGGRRGGVRDPPAGDGAAHSPELGTVASVPAGEERGRRQIESSCPRGPDGGSDPPVLEGLTVAAELAELFHDALELRWAEAVAGIFRPAHDLRHHEHARVAQRTAGSAAASKACRICG